MSNALCKNEKGNPVMGCALADAPAAKAKKQHVNPSRRSADKFFEDRPDERSRAVQTMNTYHGNDSAARILAWLTE